MKRKLRNKHFLKLKDIFWKKVYLQHEKCQFVIFVELIFMIQKCLNFAKQIFTVKQ